MLSLAIVVPCFNEEAVLPSTLEALLAIRGRLIAAGKIGAESRIYFVDDGSKDRTWTLIDAAARERTGVAGIKLARNVGHQNALMAGLFTADGDAVVTIDADLQDDVRVIEEMVDLYVNGVDIVYGVRSRRDTDSTYKKCTAEFFYRIMKLLGAPTIDNHADYRLMSRRAIEALKQFREVNLFLRGMVPLLGFRSAVVTYGRSARMLGETKYSFRKMASLAIDAITSFSVLPMRAVGIIGLSIFILTMAMSCWVLWVRLFTQAAIPGWASTLLPMFFLSGVQLLCLGVIGEYIGKIYKETKRRPRYLIECMTDLSHAVERKSPFPEQSHAEGPEQPLLRQLPKR